MQLHSAVRVVSDVVALIVVSPSICVALVVVATQIWGGQTPLKTKEIDPDIKDDRFRLEGVGV